MKIVFPNCSKHPLVKTVSKIVTDEVSWFTTKGPLFCLFNVLKGEMSLVGPRPELPVFVEQLKKTIPYYDIRHDVRPGVTGCAQVSYPYGASEEDALRKLEYDLYYLTLGPTPYEF